MLTDNRSPAFAALVACVLNPIAYAKTMAVVVRSLDTECDLSTVRIGK